MWQSRLEIEHYSIAHLDHITVFEVLYTVLSLWVRLIHTVQTLEYLIHLHSAYEPHP